MDLHGCKGHRAVFIEAPSKRTQHCWMLHVVRCVRLHTLLHVVACCWDLLRKSVKPFKLLPLCHLTQQLPKLLGQHCCELLRSFARNLSVLKPESITRVAEMQIKRRYSLKKKTRWSNEKTIIGLGYHKISWFVSVSHTVWIICLSLRLRQIIDLLATDKSRYFAQPCPIIIVKDLTWGANKLLPSRQRK